MLSNTNAKKLWMNRDINLKYIQAREYCDNIELNSIKDKTINYGYIAIHYIWLFAIAFIISFLLFFALTSKSSANDIQTEIRKARIDACTQAYYEYQAFVDSKYIHTTQNIVLRCATFSSLVFAKESWYWKSNRCLNHLNCFWLKNLSVDLKPLEWINTEVVDNRFLKFESYDDGNLLFARLYMRWNFNKDIITFVRWWSTTDQETYISFVSDKYWVTYKELKKIF